MGQEFMNSLLGLIPAVIIIYLKEFIDKRKLNREKNKNYRFIVSFLLKQIETYKECDFTLYKNLYSSLNDLDEFILDVKKCGLENVENNFKYDQLYLKLFEKISEEKKQDSFYNYDNWVIGPLKHTYFIEMESIDQQNQFSKFKMISHLVDFNFDSKFFFNYILLIKEKKRTNLLNFESKLRLTLFKIRYITSGQCSDADLDFYYPNANNNYKSYIYILLDKLETELYETLL